MKKEGWFYLAICLAVVAFLCISQFFSLDYVSKLITTSLALVSAVAFWLQFRRTERLNESNYILNMNNP